MHDATEAVRRQLAASLNSQPKTCEELEAEYGLGNVLDTRGLAQMYVIVGFKAPFLVVRRKSDGVLGSLLLQNQPRLYFGFKED